MCHEVKWSATLEFTSTAAADLEGQSNASKSPTMVDKLKDKTVETIQISLIDQRSHCNVV
jgi:hypothetical protein